jgi:hypothetical protein
MYMNMTRVIGSIALLLAAFCTCTTQIRHYLEEPSKKAPQADTAGKKDTVSTKKPTDSPPAAAVFALLPPPPAVEIDDWPGKWFVLLEKGQLYCKYGYDLYICPKLDTCRGAPDTAFETKYRRARCDRFAGHRMRVVSVEPRGEERLLCFEDEQSGRKYYARTSKGVYLEAAPEDDLAAAKKRWAGAVIFSARGFVTRFEASGNTSVKVKLQDSLRVTDVRFGLAPLPTKPIWIMVETPRGEKGTIPVCVSWTNVKKELRHAGNPWDGDIFEVSPAQLYTVDAATWDVINAHSVRAGMTRDEVRLSWGAPHRQKSAAYKGAERECWVYEKQHLYFDANELVAIEENEDAGK